MPIERNNKFYQNNNNNSSSNNFAETNNNNDFLRLQLTYQHDGSPSNASLSSGTSGQLVSSKSIPRTSIDKDTSSSASSHSSSTIAACAPVGTDTSSTPAAAIVSAPVTNITATATAAAPSNYSYRQSLQSDDESYFNHQDPFGETIDYTDALIKEDRKSQEVISRLNSHDVDALQDSNQVQIGFAPKVNTRLDNIHDIKAQNHLIFDVLPSFEMYQSLHSSPEELFQTSNQSIQQIGDDFPPDYFNHRFDVPSYDISTTCSSSNTPCPSLSLVSTNVDSHIHNHVAEDITSSNVSTNHPAPSIVSNPPVPVSQPPPNASTNTVYDFEKNIIDSAHLLYNYDSFDLKIDIHVTKDVPFLNKPSETESMLKEYTSGDVVHGYVIVENIYDEPIEFKMFHVTLEGYTSIVDNEHKKQIFKKFLTMVDLSASWSHGNISPSANLSFEAYSKDYEGCILGLPKNRILAPKTKYKKYFTFKLPYNLLDSTCRHQQEIHTLLPPSFGVDRIKKRGKYSNLKVDPILNYGNLKFQGSPILTDDLSGDVLSINYSINARIIGYTPKNQSRLCILKDQEYSLRFIPFGFVTPIISSKKDLEFLCLNIERVFQVADRALKLNNKNLIENVEISDMNVKLRQLNIGNSNNDVNSGYNSNDYKFSIRNHELNNNNNNNSDFTKIENHLDYVYKNHSNLLKSNFLNKLKNINKNDSINNKNFTKSGLITISTTIPKEGLPYYSPKLISKTNELTNLSISGSLNNQDLLNEELSIIEKQELSNINFKLKFSPSDHSLELSPPDLKTIKTSLSIFNIYSTSSIPIKISYDLLKENEFNKLKTKFKKYETTYEELKTKFNNKSNISKSDQEEEEELDINSFIDETIIQDIKSMNQLKVEKYIISPIDFEPQYKTSQWSKSSSSSTTSDHNSITQSLYSWERTIDISNFSFPKNLNQTLIPNFQTCLLSRIYCINFNFYFINDQNVEINVPIRVRKFENI